MRSAIVGLASGASAGAYALAMQTGPATACALMVVAAIVGTCSDFGE